MTTFDPQKLKLHEGTDHRSTYLTYDGAIVAVRHTDPHEDPVMRFIPSNANTKECEILKANWEAVLEAVDTLGYYCEGGSKGVIRQRDTRLIDHFNAQGRFVDNDWSRDFLCELAYYLPLDSWTEEDYFAARRMYEAYERCLRSLYDSIEARDFGYTVPIALSLFIEPQKAIRDGRLIQTVTLINAMVSK